MMKIQEKGNQLRLARRIRCDFKPLDGPQAEIMELTRDQALFWLEQYPLSEIRDASNGDGVFLKLIISNERNGKRGFLQLMEIRQHAENRIKELKELIAEIDDTPRGSMSLNFSEQVPGFKKKYLGVGSYIKKHDWNYA